MKDDWGPITNRGIGINFNTVNYIYFSNTSLCNICNSLNILFQLDTFDFFHFFSKSNKFTYIIFIAESAFGNAPLP